MSVMVNSHRFGGGGAPTPHRWWRLFFPDGSSNAVSNRMQITELEFRETAGGADAVPVYASNSTYVTNHAFGSSQFSGSYHPRQAFNDSTADDGWMTSNGADNNSYVGFFFEAPTCAAVDLREIVMTANPWGDDSGPITIVVEYSDDSTNGTDGTWTQDTGWPSMTGLTWTLNQARTFTKP